MKNILAVAAAVFFTQGTAYARSFHCSASSYSNDSTVAIGSFDIETAEHTWKGVVAPAPYGVWVLCIGRPDGTGADRLLCTIANGAATGTMPSASISERSESLELVIPIEGVTYALACGQSKLGVNADAEVARLIAEIKNR